MTSLANINGRGRGDLPREQGEALSKTSSHNTVLRIRFGSETIPIFHYLFLPCISPEVGAFEVVASMTLRRGI